MWCWHHDLSSVLSWLTGHVVLTSWLIISFVMADWLCSVYTWTYHQVCHGWLALWCLFLDLSSGLSWLTGLVVSILGLIIRFIMAGWLCGVKTRTIMRCIMACWLCGIYTRTYHKVYHGLHCVVSIPGLIIRFIMAGWLYGIKTRTYHEVYHGLHCVVSIPGLIIRFIIAGWLCGVYTRTYHEVYHGWLIVWPQCQLCRLLNIADYLSVFPHNKPTIMKVKTMQ